MEEKKGRSISVVGHKNPDTDSICSAIAYARLKRMTTGKNYVPRRAGHINQETLFVLDKFEVPAPELLDDVRPQVRDTEFRHTQGVKADMSLREAWKLMEDLDVVTLPITTEGNLDGLITIGDITNSYMNVYDSAILSKAATSYANICKTLEGQIIVGNEEECISQGKVLVAAANPDLMESYINEHDLVILGNRYESQLCAIEMKAGCIVVCDGAPVSLTIRKLATENGCTVISTPFDTFSAARLINLSMPIGYFMKEKGIISFYIDDFIDDIKDIMANKRYRDFPILDKDQNYLGMISRRNLLGLQRKKVVLVDHNEFSQAVDGIDSADIQEIIDHHRIGSLETINPVFFRNQPLGCTATIVYQMYQEADVEIDAQTAGLLCSAIISDTLLYRSPTCTAMDKRAAEELAKIAGIDTKTHAKEMFAAGSALDQKSDKEIFSQDYKVFDMNGTSVGIAQISSMDEDELNLLKERLIPFLQAQHQKKRVDMNFFLLTSILEETSYCLSDSPAGEQLVLQAFPGSESGDFCTVLPGVVSRKKQFVPALLMALQA